MFFGKNPSIPNEKRSASLLPDLDSIRLEWSYTTISAPTFTSKARAADAWLAEISNNPIELIYQKHSPTGTHS